MEGKGAASVVRRLGGQCTGSGAHVGAARSVVDAAGVTRLSADVGGG